MVEELLPTAVALMAKMNMNKGIVFGLYRFLDKCHMCLLGRASAFSNIAPGAGTNDVLPDGFAAYTSGDDVVEREFAGWELPAAVLTPVSIASKDVSAVKFYLVSRQTVVEQQPDNPGHGNMEIDGRYPVVAVRLKMAPKLADLAPALEIIVGISALFERNDLSKLTKQQRECPSGTHYADSHIMLV